MRTRPQPWHSGPPAARMQADPAEPEQLSRAAALALLQETTVYPGMPQRLAATVAPLLFGPVISTVLRPAQTGGTARQLDGATVSMSMSRA